jgi:hypothetical protein
MTPIPGRSFQIAGLIALSGILAAMFSVSREPAQAVSSPVASKFDARWDDATDVTADSFPLLKKTDRLKIEEPGPVPVRTERVVLVQPQDKVEEKRAKPKKTEPTKVATAEHGVCTRHHLRTVMTHGGRSWRCRK